MTRDPVHELDRATVEAARRVRVLTSIAWGPELAGPFLEAWRSGRRELPRPATVPVELAAERQALEAIAARCDRREPRQAFIAATADSYAVAARMLGAIGTPAFTGHSIALYGRPDEVWTLQGWSPVDAAQFFLGVTEDERLARSADGAGES